MNAKSHRLWQLTDLLIWTARDVCGQPVGRVADVIVDPAEGRVAYLRIRLNPRATSADSLITVPWSAISRLSESRQEIWIAARRATLLQLGSAPARYGPASGP